MLGGADTTCPT